MRRIRLSRQHGDRGGEVHHIANVMLCFVVTYDKGEKADANDRRALSFAAHSTL